MMLFSLQAIGGEMASSTIMNSGNPAKGGHIMLGALSNIFSPPHLAT
jgi:hypothetical protein